MSKLTRCVLDAENQSRFITASLIDDLKLQAINEREVTVCAFASQFAQSIRRGLVRFNMKGIWTHFAVSIIAFERAHVLSAQPAAPQDVKILSYARKLQLDEPKTYPQEFIPVEILIGGDH
jgi:hypothetical protein